MELQTAYERIRAYFNKPGADFAVDTQAGLCRYRTIRGGVLRKCAVGVLIPDEQYSPDFEGDSASRVLDEIGVEGGDLVEFCEQAQLAHDGQAFGSGGGSLPAFIRELDDLARSYGLAAPAAS